MEQNERFEREYRAALDGLRFSDAGKVRIMKNLMEREKRRTVRPLRTALIAACLVLALVGTAFAAAELTGVWIMDLFNNESRAVNEGWEPEIYSGYIVGGDINYYPMDALSPEISQIGQNSDRAVEKGFPSWEDMERFLGINIMDNPVLAEAPSGVEYGISQNGCSAYVACVNVRDHLVPRVWMYGSYLLYPGKGTFPRDGGGVNITLQADLYTESGTVSAEYNTHRYYFPEGTKVSQKEYTTPNGLPVKIFRIDWPDEVTYQAEFSLNSILFTVQANCCEDSDFLLTTLIEVLDGFVV